MDSLSRRASISSFSTSQSRPIVWATFSGRSREDVTAFIRRVQQTAVEQLRQEDDGWVAQYAAGCLTGPAMIWHAELEDNIQTSWRNLRRALLQRYEVDDAYSIATYREQLVEAPSVTSPPAIPSIPLSATFASTPTSLSTPTSSSTSTSASPPSSLPDSPTNPLNGFIDGIPPRQGHILLVDGIDGRPLGRRVKRAIPAENDKQRPG